jgi:hypothetical protein
MGRKGTKTGRSGADNELALGLARGLSTEAAAKAAKVSRQTAFRRKKNHVFMSRVHALQAELTERAVGRLSAIAADAAERLGKLLKVKNPAIQLSAARAILDFTLKGAESVSLPRRLAEIESRLGIGKGKKKWPALTSGSNGWNRLLTNGRN